MGRPLPRCKLIGLCAVAVGACALRPTPEPAGTAAELPAAGSLPLPAGAGRAILERECLNCHELGALELFKGFYSRDRWRALVITMRDNGAEVDDEQVEVLATYLARHFGTGLE